jgi:anti-anti-sigma regulatory factor
MSEQDVFEFQYFISEKNGFVVASLVGLLEEAAMKRFEQLNEDIFKIDFSKLVINFRDVSGISNEIIPLFARLQKQARAKQADLRICGLKPDLKERLNRAGILRPHEQSDNLQAALQSMIAQVRRAS